MRNLIPDQQPEKPQQIDIIAYSEFQKKSENTNLIKNTYQQINTSKIHQ